MPDDMEPTSQKQVTLIPTVRVRVLNPRVRNRRTFEAMVDSIARIGLKRPITVAPRAGTDPQEYDLVCGQGRLEAFIEAQAVPYPGHRDRGRRKRLPRHEPRRKLRAAATQSHRPDA